jgi:hypothetical protein
MRRILMKKLCLLSVFISLFCFSAFCNSDEQEEVDFLLFLPDSSNKFANEEQAMRQLDNLAEYLKGRDLMPGKIHVYGYSAAFANDIDATDISRDRAYFVINELQIRGVSGDLFSEPIAYGEANLWGSNADEDARGPNRRVRILLDGDFLTPAVIEAAEPEVQISAVEEEAAEEEVVAEDVITQAATGKSCSIFPWILLPLLLLLLLAALLFFLLRKKKTVIAAAPIVVPAATTVLVVNLDEEILFCSYMLYLQRNGQSENAYEDWLKAVTIICTKYEADGYQAYMEDWSWWARKEV